MYLLFANVIGIICVIRSIEQTHTRATKKKDLEFILNKYVCGLGHCRTYSLPLLFILSLFPILCIG